MDQELIGLLSQAGLDLAGGEQQAAEECALVVLRSSWSSREVQQALLAVVADGLLHSWRRGWQPYDLFEVARRRLSPEHLPVYLAALKAAMAPYARATVDARWQQQVVELHAHPVPVSKRRGHVDAIGAITVGIELFALLASLSRVEQLLPLPGTAHPVPRPAAAVDQKALSRVRALLAKAESTEFEEEAEALSAKAQELMTRHSLELLVVESPGPLLRASASRIWLEDPYSRAKAMLVHVVASANRCTSVWTPDPGFITLIGDDRDLAAAELLATSLLVQATRALLHTPPRQDKRSFRQSFLVAYAQRIGERLQDADQRVVDELRGTGAELVPALAAQQERVEATKDQLFPSTRASRVTVRNEHGYEAGLAAAARASLDGQRKRLP